MFIIIGGDGKEYGPATVQQVRSWIDGGRANLDTQARAPGSEEWRRLGDFVEFGGTVTALPPPLPGVGSAGPATTLAGAPAGPGFTAPVASAGELAGIGARTGAALVNAVFYFLSLLPGSLLMSKALLEQNPQLAKGGVPRLEDLDLSGILGNVIWVWAGLVAALLLQALVLAVRGQNLGKLLVGVRVVRFETGAPAGFGRTVLLRFALPVGLIFLLNVVFPLGLLFLLVDYFFMFRADRRCLHDLLAGTIVVRT